MSIQAVGWVLEHSKSRGIPRLVLISLANHANDRRRCFPSQRTLAREAGVSAGSIPPAIRTLVSLGEVEVLQLGDNRRSTRYQLPLSSAQEMSTGTERSARPGLSAARGPGTEQNHKEPSMTVSAAEPHGCVNGWVESTKGDIPCPVCNGGLRVVS